MGARTIGLLGATVLAVAVVGCGRKENYTDTSAARGASTSAAPTDSSARASATAAPALTDANIVYILDEANASDSARGRLASTKGTSTDVKNFGKLMVGEHHSLRQAGQQLAKKLNVTPQAPAADQSEAQVKTEMDCLQAMPKGKAWDKAYIDYEVTYHQAVLQTATKALDAAQNQELKDLIKKAAPVIQKHLDRAKQIQSKQGA